MKAQSNNTNERNGFLFTLVHLAILTVTTANVLNAKTTTPPEPTRYISTSAYTASTNWLTTCQNVLGQDADTRWMFDQCADDAIAYESPLQD
ncbi:MAG: hypothetical protein AAF570_18960, partial [Bacteroidota bacterium]